MATARPEGGSLAQCGLYIVVAAVQYWMEAPIPAVADCDVAGPPRRIRPLRYEPTLEESAFDTKEFGPKATVPFTARRKAQRSAMSRTNTG